MVYKPTTSYAEKNAALVKSFEVTVDTPKRRESVKLAEEVIDELSVEIETTPNDEREHAN